MSYLSLNKGANVRVVTLRDRWERTLTILAGAPKKKNIYKSSSISTTHSNITNDGAINILLRARLRSGLGTIPYIVYSIN